MINKTILIGNLGKDPEIKTLESGVKIASFSFATTEKWKDKNGDKQEETQWHNISAFGKQAETIERYVKKGFKLYIEGKIKYRAYEDKEGIKRYVTDIHVINFQMLDSKQPETKSTEPIDTTKLPFE